jgi:transposase
MGRYIGEADRTQTALFPESLDEWIDEDSTVRVIDVFINELDLRALGFERAEPAATGRPAYHPATLLKIYVYGYLNRIQSSRRLETEAHRNIELIWLTGRLAPDFKTIADFRKDNGEAIRKVCREFVLLCRRLDLFSEGVVAIDGSKFKAVNNRHKNFTEHKIQVRMQQLEENIAHYLAELDRADRDPALVLPSKVARLKERIGRVKEQMSKLAAMAEQVKASPDGQVSLTDSDARAMTSTVRSTGTVGYNVQAAVDAKNHLVLAHEVTNQINDRDQLAGMSISAKAAAGAESLTALADRGYYDGPQLRQAELAGVTTLVPKPLTSNSRAEGRFDKRDFVYDAANDQYRCPAGQIAIHRFVTKERGIYLSKYWSSSCPTCPIKHRCTTSEYRRISRWEHEAVLERVQARLDATPEAAKVRMQTVEHVFGTLKSWMGPCHFLTKTLPKVRTEMSLQVLAYNMKRVIKILGTRKLVQAIAA